MASEVAEVVAVVRAEKRDFERGMQEADQTIEQSGERVRRTEREKQRAFGDTTASLGRVRVGLIAAGLAAATAFGGMMASSAVVAPQVQRTGQLLGLIAGDVARFLGLPDAVKGFNRFLGTVRKGTKNAPKARAAREREIFDGLSDEEMEKMDRRSVFQRLDDFRVNRLPQGVPPLMFQNPFGSAFNRGAPPAESTPPAGVTIDVRVTADSHEMRSAIEETVRRKIREQLEAPYG